MICKESCETVDHIFTTCRKAIEVRRAVNGWANLLPMHCTKVSEINDEASVDGPAKGVFTLKQVTGQAYIWSIWKGRNDALFNHNEFNSLNTANIIQSFVFMWYMSRGARGSSLDWVSWCRNPFSLNLPTAG